MVSPQKQRRVAPLPPRSNRIPSTSARTRSSGAPPLTTMATAVASHTAATAPSPMRIWMHTGPIPLALARRPAPGSLTGGASTLPLSHQLRLQRGPRLVSTEPTLEHRGEGGAPHLPRHAPSWPLALPGSPRPANGSPRPPRTKGASGEIGRGGRPVRPANRAIPGSAPRRKRAGPPVTSNSSHWVMHSYLPLPSERSSVRSHWTTCPISSGAARAAHAPPPGPEPRAPTSSSHRPTGRGTPRFARGRWPIPLRPAAASGGHHPRRARDLPSRRARSSPGGRPADAGPAPGVATTGRRAPEPARPTDAPARRTKLCT
ncbi:hypothetical protein SAMN05414137_11428 [Streptacidiphilus jiangxiensis]|uniref:Uncharacterized protein n=1 Tax=Streptacidiphilus jiangxiensis TaxID=235985 RepID=A0A1H7TL08_STRJI|nr:hypothetical protein SAMN05414137_11428 [Streptacidiphilus jiangxiensis]